MSLTELTDERTFLFPATDQVWQRFWDGVDYRSDRPITYAGHYRTLEGLVALLKTSRGVRIATEHMRRTIGRSEIVGGRYRASRAFNTRLLAEPATTGRASPPSSQSPGSSSRPDLFALKW